MSEFIFKQDDIQEAAIGVKAGVGDFVIVEVEVKETKSGGEGMMLQVQPFPQEAGNKFSGFQEWINTKHRTSPVAEKMGRSKLARICSAIGLVAMTDTDQLLEKPFQATIQIKESEAFGPQATMTRIKACSDEATDTFADSQTDKEMPF